MIFFDRNKQKVSSIAKEVLSQVTDTGESPDLIINKIASNYSLNDSWKQRIVEEFNIIAFLQKLEDGTQHEHYQVAQPVLDECKQWIHIGMDNSIPEKSDSGIKKTASYNSVGAIPINAFDYNSDISSFDNMTIGGDNYDDSIELEKVAFYKESERQRQEDEELIKEASYYVSLAENQLIGELVKVANITPGFTKHIVHSLYKRGCVNYAEDVVTECRWKPDEIVDSSLLTDAGPRDLDKLASVAGLIENIAKMIPVKKMARNSVEKAKDIIRKAKSKPKSLGYALILANGGRHLYKEKNGATEVPLNIEAFKNQ